MIHAILVLALGAAAQAVPNWTDIVARLDAATAAADAAALRTAIADAEKLADATGLDRERELALNGAAYGEWRLSTTAGVSPDESARLLKSAEKNLRELLKLNPKSGEASALLASVLGQMIRLGGGAGKMTLGPESSEMREQALKLEPNNPRVMLQAAITLFRTQPQYGGGPEKAEPLLRQALALFDREPARRPWPNWGRFDVHAWLGQVLAARGDKAGARAEYEAALGVWPGNEWVKAVLLPALDR
jgi:tetratricopeptide (TPR) repeat protein